jgi:hypothetical protein
MTLGYVHEPSVCGERSGLFDFRQAGAVAGAGGLVHPHTGTILVADGVVNAARAFAGDAVRGFLAVLVWGGVLFLALDCQAADWSFNPLLTIYQQYDSNILFSSLEQQNDFITSVQPMLSMSATGEQTQFSLNSTVNGYKYTKYSQYDTVETNNTAVLNQQWTPQYSNALTALFVKDTTMDSQLSEAGLQGRKVEQYVYNLGLKNKYAFTETFSTSVTASGGQTFYPDKTYPDSQVFLADLSPEWLLSLRDTVGVYSGYVEKEYTGSSTIHNLMGLVFWQRAWNETTSMNLQAGYRFSQIEHYTFVFEKLPGGGLAIVRKKETAQNNGFVFSAGLRTNWTERLSTALSARHEQYASADARIYNHTYAQSNVKYLLSELNTFYCDAQYDFNAETVTGGERSNYLQIIPSLVHKLNETLSLKFSGSNQYQIKSNFGTDRTIERYRLWLELTWQWPRLFSDH